MQRNVKEVYDAVCLNCGKREILIWGYKSVFADEIEQVLCKDGFVVKGRIDSNKAFINNETVFSPDILNDAKEKYYIVIPLGVYEEIQRTIIENGLEKEIDYLYFCDCAVKRTDTYYEDAHGNVINGFYGNAEFVFLGYNSVVNIGTSADVSGRFRVGSNCKISIGRNTTFDAGKSGAYIGSETKLVVGDNCEIVNDYSFFIGRNAMVSVGDWCKIERGRRFICRENGTALIGNKTKINIDSDIVIQDSGYLSLGNGLRIGTDLRLLTCSNSKLELGDEILISWNVTIVSRDGHSIFDTKLKRRIDEKNKDIIIGKHVWIGANSNLLPMCMIGSGCIVGAGSVAKGVFPNNCMIAGNPARIIRKNVAWNKKYTENMLDCNEEYCKLTIEE